MDASTETVGGSRQPAALVQERRYPSWPGIPVLIFAIAAVVVGILIISHGPIGVGFGIALLYWRPLGLPGSPPSSRERPGSFSCSEAIEAASGPQDCVG